MRIVYVGKHGPHDNEDEDAVTYALRQLGHSVLLVEVGRADTVRWEDMLGDFLLFNKWCDSAALRRLRIPAVKWDWDLVESHDPTIANLDARRRREVEPVEPYCAVCFYSDGDWVAKDPAKRVQLFQGADERYAGYGEARSGVAPILFTGRLDCHGKGRSGQIRALQEHYGDKFQIVGDPPATKVHGRALADLFAGTKVVVAPITPSTDRYWSNRIFLTMSLGGFIIHPLCSEMLLHYYPSGTATMYSCDSHLHDLIDYYLGHDAEREELRRAGFEHTLKNHTYRRRCSDLVEIVKQRL